MKSYRTILKESCFELEEKRSRFIARSKPVKTEQEAIEFIQSVKALCWDAAHNCYAYSVMEESLFQRYSDDGEPQGTAGLPMLEVIRKKGLQNVVVVVTRYFGGILLGAGGLARAYGKACAGGLEQAGEILVKPCLEIKLSIEYHLAGKIHSMLLSEGYILAETEYMQDVTFTVYVEKERRESLEEKIRDITGGVLKLELAGIRNVALDQAGKVLENEFR